MLGRVITRSVQVTLGVILTLVAPWVYSNVGVLEEVREAKRDANAAKVAVTRLRAEIRGEAEPGEEVEALRQRQLKPAPAETSVAGRRRIGMSMTRYLKERSG